MPGCSAETVASFNVGPPGRQVRGKGPRNARGGAPCGAVLLSYQRSPQAGTLALASTLDAVASDLVSLRTVGPSFFSAASIGARRAWDPSELRSSIAELLRTPRGQLMPRHPTQSPSEQGSSLSVSVQGPTGSLDLNTSSVLSRPP